MSSEVLLKLENVHKHFGGVKAVNGVDFEIYSNRITGLIGPNGAGKSTIFNLITGFSEIDDGFIYFLDEDISYSSPKKTVDQGILRTFQIPGELIRLGLDGLDWIGSDLGEFISTLIGGLFNVLTALTTIVFQTVLSFHFFNLSARYTSDLSTLNTQ